MNLRIDPWIAATFYKPDPLTLAKMEIVRKIIRGHRVVDVGCGAGWTSLQLADQGHYVIAVDINPYFLRRLKNHPHIKCVVADATKYLKTENVQADAALVLDLLEHLSITERVRLLRSLAEAKVQELLICVPAHKWLWTKHDDVEQHYLRYTEKQLIQELESTGWHVSWIQPWNIVFIPLKILAAGRSHESIRNLPTGLSTLLSKILVLDFRMNRLFGLSFFAYATRDVM